MTAAITMASSAHAQSLPDLPDAPQVQLPVPTVVAPPAVPIPVPRVPSTPVVSVPAAPRVPSVTSVSAPSARAVAPAPAAARSAAPAEARVQEAARAALGGGTPSSSPPPAAAKRAAKRAQRRDRTLRRTVHRLRECLGELPARSRHVLRLRAGLATAHPRTRPRVARILDLPARRVGRIERRALRQLKANARDGCGTAQAAAAAAAVSHDTYLAAEPLGSTAAAPAANGESQDRSEVKSETAKGGTEPEKATRPSPLGRLGGLIVPHDGKLSLLIPLGLLLLLGVVAAALLGIRRRRARQDYGYY